MAEEYPEEDEAAACGLVPAHRLGRAHEQSMTKKQRNRIAIIAQKKLITAMYRSSSNRS